jgi:AcrR family transcriptional regulator
MPRPKVGDKRSAILAAAIEAIAEDGTSASTAKIARFAAVAEGSLFRYFADKDTLLNELYLELKLDVQAVMTNRFPVSGSLRRRMQHMWNAYIAWGMASPSRRRAMIHLNVFERITDESKQKGQVGFEDTIEAMQELIDQGRFRRMPQTFASNLFLAMAETTMTSMYDSPSNADRFRKTGFEAFWNAADK